jgi:hypothetical protein
MAVNDGYNPKEKGLPVRTSFDGRKGGEPVHRVCRAGRQVCSMSGRDSKAKTSSGWRAKDAAEQVPRPLDETDESQARIPPYSSPAQHQPKWTTDFTDSRKMR